MRSRAAATRRCETQWHNTQRVERRPDGSVDLSFRVVLSDEFVRGLLPWAGSVTIINPPGLKERLFNVLEESLQKNSEAV